MKSKIYPFINDLVFKCVFGQQKNVKLLICLLNAILHRKGGDTIVGAEILNPFSIQEFEADKLTIVDLKARSKRGEWFSVEVQMESQASYVARSVYYLSKLYSNQLVEGENFTSLARATGISILNFRLFPDNSAVQNVFRLKNTKTDEELFDAFELNFIELPKVLDDPERVPETPFERWIHILKYSTEYYGSPNLPLWAEKEEGIAMAMHQLEKVNADKQYRQLLETREKSELVYRTLLAEATQRGLEEGRQMGREEGREKGREARDAELVHKMLEKGKSPEEISEILDRSLSDVLRFADNFAKKPSPNRVCEPVPRFSAKIPKKKRSR
jgi:predicted transposase/invertase (TIGR01784 family)